MTRHSCRQQPSGFLFSLVDRIGFVDAVSWDQVVADSSLFLQRDTLALLEEHGPPGMRPHYAMVHRGDEPVAALACQTVDLTADQLVSEHDVDGLTDRLKQATLGKLRGRTMFVGNLYCWGNHGVAFAPGEDPAELWPGIADALYRMRRAEKLNGAIDYVLVKDLGPRLQATAKGLRQFGYRSFETEPDMVLSLDPSWTSFDDYTAQLTAKYRRAIKKTEKGVTDAGFELRRIDDLSPHADRLHSLYRNVQERAEVRLTRLTPGYLPALAELLGPERFRCSALVDGEKWVGFVTTLRDGDRGIGYFLGIDYEASERAPVYHRLLQQVVADAIDLGCTEISFGRTALDAKARLGCQPRSQATWVRHRGPVRNKLLRKLVCLFQADEAPERSPFKTS
ncbi:MAG: GNAT family N-acetyltransferase [Acidobacteriota bacterium]